VREDERRTELIGIFIKAFSKYGLDRATTKKLAAEANLSEAGLYVYFKNKEDLLSKCVEEHFRKVSTDINELAQRYGTAPDTFAKAMFSYTKSMLHENRFIFQMLSHPVYSEMIKDMRKGLVNVIGEQSAMLQRFNLSMETSNAFALLYNSALNNYILTQDEDGFMLQLEFLLKLLENERLQA